MAANRMNNLDSMTDDNAEDMEVWAQDPKHLSPSNQRARDNLNK